MRSLDLTKTGTLDPTCLKDVLHSFGDRLTISEVERVLRGLPRDGLGRVRCADIAKKLAKGPPNIPHL